MQWLCKKVAGFYTIQILIYIVVSSLMSFLFVNFFTTCYKNKMAGNSSLQENLNINLAFDTFLKDYYLSTNMLILDDESILFNLPDYDVYWSLKKDRLMRIFGKYLGNGLWIDKSSNLILKDLSIFNIKRRSGHIDFYLKSKSNIEFSCPMALKLKL